MEIQERIDMLADALGVDPLEMKEGYRETVVELDDGREYLVLTEDEADEEAIEDVKNVFDALGLESFSEDFRGWIYENALDESWFEDACRESYEFYVDDIENENSVNFDNRLIEELYDEDLLTDEDFEEDEDGEIDYTTVKDSVDIGSLRDEYVEKLTSQYEDNYVQWYIDNFGLKDLSDFVKDKANLIDIDKVAEEVVRLDGRANGLARYDGEELDLGKNSNGEYVYAYREN